MLQMLPNVTAVAHLLWKPYLRRGGHVIDATCGNGKDTLFLAQNVLTPTSGKVIGYDIQESAINKTRSYLQSHLPPLLFRRVILRQQCHSQIATIDDLSKVNIVVYNLGYCPGGDTSITTTTSTTISSLKSVAEKIQRGGLISVCCYGGHLEGKKEADMVKVWSSSLPKKEWRVVHVLWRNVSLKAPFLVLIQKLREARDVNDDTDDIMTSEDWTIENYRIPDTNINVEPYVNNISNITENRTNDTNVLK
jgi:hypothetical protein